MIRYYKTADHAVVARVLSAKITKHLAGGRVLWLVGGGSVIKIAVEVSVQLRQLDGLSNLSVSLTDERFGPVDHADSNWKQLITAGFTLKDANLQPVLKNASLNQTTAGYTKFLKAQLAHSTYTIALAGIGADGHIFGIKPHSPAVESQLAVVGYKWDDYIRLTPTTQLIKQLDEIVIYAAGAEKHAQLDRIEQAVPAQEQPAQLLKQARLVSIYNDYKGEKL